VAGFDLEYRAEPFTPRIDLIARAHDTCIEDGWNMSGQGPILKAK
jgi:hypothetical protein